MVIPLFWIPVHFFSVSFRKIGLAAYLLPLFVWLPLTVLIYENWSFFLRYAIAIPSALSIVGWVFLISGIALHLWTARLLGILGIIGVPELSLRMQSHLVTTGPFSIVRHPTYFAHTLIFSGVFLITGALSVGILVILDFLVVNSFIIPLEEKELMNRFGDEYKIYKTRVSSQFFPFIF